MATQVDAKGMKIWSRERNAWVDMVGKTKIWSREQNSWITPSKTCIYQRSNDTWYCASGKPTLPQLVIVGSGGNIITNEDIPND
jgi:hypothetical protein